jgi:ubiquinone/menaquinone biosynthesis C-methylase UbiE
MIETPHVHPCTFFTGTSDLRDQSNWYHLIAKYIPNINEKRILDVGCDRGYLLQDLAKISKSTVGVDFRHIETDPSSGFMFVQADCHNLPFYDHSFDLVMSLFMLEHVSDYEMAITEMKRVLNPGGYLLLFMGPTPLWKYLDNPEHRKTIPKNPEISKTMRLLQDGDVSKIWNENIQYRLFEMETFKLFPTNPILAKLFRSLLLRKMLSSSLKFLEQHNLEQNMCLVYKHKV